MDLLDKGAFGEQPELVTAIRGAEVSHASCHPVTQAIGGLLFPPKKRPGDKR